MTKKNIFEKINGAYSYSLEMSRLEELIHAKGGVKLENSTSNSSIPAVSFFPLEEFIDKTVFRKWKGRGSCISCKDMRKELGIAQILAKEDPSAEEFLTYLEYVANLFFLFRTTNLIPGYRHCETLVTVAARENLERNLELLNSEILEFSAEERVVIVEKNAPAKVASETVDTSLGNLINLYNHHSMAGDLESKREILGVMGRELELNRVRLSELNQRLTSSLFYLLSYLDIRRSGRNKNDFHYRDAVSKMPPEELESWYDELYQMCIFAFLTLEQEDSYDRVKKLMDKMDCSC